MDFRQKTSCSVRTCENSIYSSRKSGEKINFHQFPLKNKILTEKWKFFCDRGDDWIPNNRSLICSKHFTRDSYSLAYNLKEIGLCKAILTADAVPTIFEPRKSENAPLPEEERKSIVQELLSSYETSKGAEEQFQIMDEPSQIQLEQDSIESELIQDMPGDKIHTFGQLLNLISRRSDSDTIKSWNLISQPNGVCFYKLTVDQTFTDVKFLVKIIIDQSLKVTVYFRDFQISPLETGITKLIDWLALESLLRRFEKTWQVELNSRFHIQKAMSHLCKIEDKDFLMKFRKKISMARDSLNEIVIHPDYKSTGCEEDVILYEQVEGESEIESFKEQLSTEDYEIIEPEMEIEEQDIEAEYIVNELIEVLEDKSDDENFELEFSEDCQEEIIPMDPETEIPCAKPKALINSNQSHVCDLCGKFYDSLKKLKSHLKDHKFRKPTTCPHCNANVSNSTLKRHIQQVHQKLTYSCQKCEKKFYRKYLKNAHEEKCDGTYKPKYSVRKNIDLNLPYYSCTIDDCKEKYFNKISLKRHCSKVHGFEFNVDKFCFECGEEFESPSLYFVHCRKHYKFECTVCCKRFKTLESKNNHQNTHEANENRPFKCDQCPGSFKSKVHLSSHKKLQHSLDRNFICQSCDRCFPDKTRLNAHIRVVHEKNSLPHKCIYCEDRYADVNSLKSHVNSKHKTDLVFECSDCKVKFKYYSDMRNHRNQIHGPLSTAARKSNVFAEFEEEIEYLEYAD